MHFLVKNLQLATLMRKWRTFLLLSLHQKSVQCFTVQVPPLPMTYLLPVLGTSWRQRWFTMTHRHLCARFRWHGGCFKPMKPRHFKLPKWLKYGITWFCPYYANGRSCFSLHTWPQRISPVTTPVMPKALWNTVSSQCTWTRTLYSWFDSLCSCQPTNTYLFAKRFSCVNPFHSLGQIFCHSCDMAEAMLTPLYISAFLAASRRNSLKKTGMKKPLALKMFMGWLRKLQTAAFGLNCVLVLPAISLARFIPKVFYSIWCSWTIRSMFSPSAASLPTLTGPQ